MRQRAAVAVFELVFVWNLLCHIGWAQSVKSPALAEVESAAKSREPKKSTLTKTIIDFELLQGDDSGTLYAHQWSKILTSLEVNVQVRRPLQGEKTGLKEREAVSTRYVTAVGTLDRSGQISFPDRTFATSDVVKLKEWIDELKTYGVLGTPSGKPMWGLTKTQFSQIYDGMAKPILFETTGLPIHQLISQVPLPQDVAFGYSADGKAELDRRGDQAKVKSELKGLSAATGLAIALSEFGVGFRPNRTPSGNLELVIDRRDSKHRTWPMGWPFERPTTKAAPKMFALVPIEVSDQRLSDIVTAAEKLTEIPILVDYADLDSRRLELDKIIVTYPLKKTNWNMALDRMLRPSHLTQQLHEDEAGKLFVWITSSKVGRIPSQEKPPK